MIYETMDRSIRFCLRGLILLNRLHTVVWHVLHLGVVTGGANLCVVFADEKESNQQGGFFDLLKLWYCCGAMFCDCVRDGILFCEYVKGAPPLVKLCLQE